MRQLVLVVIGVVIGFLVALRVGGRTDRTQPARLDARAFAAAVADGYRSREAELRRHGGTDV